MLLWIKTKIATFHILSSMHWVKESDLASVVLTYHGVKHVNVANYDRKRTTESFFFFSESEIMYLIVNTEARYFGRTTNATLLLNLYQIFECSYHIVQLRLCSYRHFLWLWVYTVKEKCTSTFWKYVSSTRLR